MLSGTIRWSATENIISQSPVCYAGDAFLDEPVSGLDPVATEEMYRLIEQINREDHITILMISHDIKAAVAYADHILEIGKQIFLGTAQEYLERT